MLRLSAILTLLLFNSCVSSLIAGKGKKYSHLETSTTQRSKIIEDLGSPIYSKTYSKPTKVKSTTEYAKHKNKFQRFEEVPNIVTNVLSNGNPNKYAKYCDVYTCRGTFHFQGINTHYEMPSAMTLGVADILFIPSAIHDRISKSKQRDYLTIWYDTNKRYIATATGKMENKSQ